MKIHLPLCFLLMLLLFPRPLEAESRNDDKLIKEIVRLLIIAYDKYEDMGFTEKMVLKYGRPAYLENLAIWQEHYHNIDGITIKLHPRIRLLVEKIEDAGEYKKARRMETLLKRLTYLGYSNLSLYYTSVKEYGSSIKPEELDLELLDDAFCTPGNYTIKKEFFAEEKAIKDEIKSILSSKELRFKLAFYLFAFNFLNGIREKIISKDMEKMARKLESRQ